MGKAGRYGDGPLHHRSVYRKRSSPCMHPQRKQITSPNRVWVPAIPSWEKEFCRKIGLFKWEEFLEAKKVTEFTDNKIFQWNDSAAEEAFHSAKNRFFAQITGRQLPNSQQSVDSPNPDLYIDDINWEADDDDATPELALDGLMEAKEDRDDDEYVADHYDIPIENIKPTGWDIDVEEISRGKVLTGLIVGS